jgi:L-fuconolactonase
MSDMPVVDSHHHFWDLDRFDYPWMGEGSPLAVNFGPDELRPLIAAAGVDYTVIVQAAQSVEETRWLLEIAENTGFVAGVVGWVDLTDRNVGDTLDDLSQSPYFKGVRHIWEGEDDPSWLYTSGAVNGLKEVERRGLCYDFLVKPPNLPYVTRVMKEVPRLRAVIDHIAKPLIKDGVFQPWLDEMRKIASINGMRCKVSGMVTEADSDSWKPDDLRPYVHHILGMFGYDRLMFGTDWPVCTLAASYEKVTTTTMDILGSLQPREKDAVFGGVAMDFYRLDIPAKE